MKPVLPNYNTLADLIDRLIVCVNKLAFFENMKRQEQGRDEKDAEKIAYWDNASRNECEMRNLLKREIDNMMGRIVLTGEYESLPDFRTFSPDARQISDVLAEQCEVIGTALKIKLEREFP